MTLMCLDVLPQEIATGLPGKDPDESEHVPVASQHGVSPGRLAGLVWHGGLVHHSGGLHALLSADLLHLDGPRVHSHVHRFGQGLQHVHQEIYLEVLPSRMGY